MPAFALEIKTYQAAAGASVRISDPGQLEFTPSRTVFLATMRLSHVQAGGWTLSEAVEKAIEMLQGDTALADVLLGKLADQGYLVQHAGFYPKRYSIEAAEVFGVSEGFPRIRAAEVPVGVGTVHFSILLSAMQPFRVASGDVLGVPGALEVAS